MWVRLAALAIGLAACTSSTAYEYPFKPLAVEFWRPVPILLPDLLVRIDQNTLTEVTPCWESSLSFRVVEGKVAFDGEFATDNSNSPECVPTRVSFNALNEALRETANIRTTEEGIALLRGDESEIARLAPVPPTGFEYRRFTVSAFRFSGKLRHVRNDGDFKPDFALYAGRIQGSSGCGGWALSKYRSVGDSKYKFSVTSVLVGACSARALQLTRRLCDAFSGIRDVRQRGHDFILRDAHGHVQVVLSPIHEKDKQ
jgi:hypothetical protein